MMMDKYDKAVLTKTTMRRGRIWRTLVRHPEGLTISALAQMEWLDTDAMLWFAGRWWSFPGVQIGAESEFEWRDNRVFLLESDGSVVEGIVFVGESRD